MKIRNKGEYITICIGLTAIGLNLISHWMLVCYVYNLAWYIKGVGFALIVMGAYIASENILSPYQIQKVKGGVK